MKPQRLSSLQCEQASSELQQTRGVWPKSPEEQGVIKNNNKKKMHVFHHDCLFLFGAKSLGAIFLPLLDGVNILFQKTNHEKEEEGKKKRIQTFSKSSSAMVSRSLIGSIDPST